MDIDKILSKKVGIAMTAIVVLGTTDLGLIPVCAIGVVASVAIVIQGIIDMKK